VDSLTRYCAYLSEWNSSPRAKHDQIRQGAASAQPDDFLLIHAADSQIGWNVRYFRRCGRCRCLTDRYIYTAFARDVARVSIRIRSTTVPLRAQTVRAFYFAFRLMSGAPHSRWAARVEFYEAAWTWASVTTHMKASSCSRADSRTIRGHGSRIRLHVIDATLPITKQQRQVRDAVSTLLTGCLSGLLLRTGNLAGLGVSGHYLRISNPKPSLPECLNRSGLGPGENSEMMPGRP